MNDPMKALASHGRYALGTATLAAEAAAGLGIGCAAPLLRTAGDRHATGLGQQDTAIIVTTAHPMM